MHHLKAFRQASNFHCLPDSIPGHIHDRHIHGLVFKKGGIRVIQTGFAGSNRCLEGMPDPCQSGRIVKIHFKPAETEIVQCPANREKNLRYGS